MEQKNPEDFEKKEVVIKGHCKDCEHNKNCPKMNGQNICRGKREKVIIYVRKNPK